MRTRVRATLLGLAILGSGTWAQAQCTKDIDCKGDRVCNAGQCTAPPAAAAPAAATPAAAAPVVQPPVAAPVAPPASPPPARAEPLRRRSPALMVTGIVLASAGPLVWLLGLKAVSNAETSCLQDATLKYASTNSPERAREVSDCRSSARTGTNAVWITGTVLLGAGAPMIVYGAKKVPGPTVTASLAPVLAPGHIGLHLRVDM